MILKFKNGMVVVQVLALVGKFKIYKILQQKDLSSGDSYGRGHFCTVLFAILFHIPNILVM